MLVMSIDAKELEAYADSLRVKADQIPYAAMRALNEATENVRGYLIKNTWPSSGINVRNPSFIAASLTTKESRASKTDLRTEIYDKLDRGHLRMQAEGGVRKPRGRAHMAVPVSSVPRTARGIPKQVKAALDKSGKRGVRRGDAIFQRDSKGKLRLLFVLKAATKIPKRVRFYEDFQRQMSSELHRLLPIWLRKAMETRRPR